MIYTGKQAKEKILQGINKLVDVVKATLGARGKTVIIQHPYGLDAHLTKDGITVAKSINFEDEVENLGADFVKNAANNTVIEAGDGTSTTSILTQSMCNDVYKEQELGRNINDITKDLKDDLKTVVEFIKEKSKKVESLDDIKNIAKVSANNDEEIGNLFRDIYEKTGFDVTIDVVESDNIETTYEIVNGFTMNETGYSSTQFINNMDKGRVEFTNPKIYFYNGKIKFMDSALMEILHNNADRNSPNFSPTVIICEDIEETPLREIVTAVSKQLIFNVAIVQSALIFQDRKNAFIDATVFTKADYSEERFMAHGECEKIIIERDKTTFINGKSDVKKHLETLEKKKDKNISDERRIFALKSIAAIVKVGGRITTEVSERKDRIEDSRMAVKSSIEEGYSPGGSTVFLFAEKLPLKTTIMRNALKSCYKQLMVNAELEPFLYLSEIYNKGFGHGYNLVKGEVSNMYDDGVFDSTKALRVSLENAVHTACNFATIESVITSK